MIRIRFTTGATRPGVPRLPARDAVLAFLAYWENDPAPRLQASYIEAFDFKRWGCLYLSYYRYGDARARGQVLADMKGAYARAGCPLDTSELPDYLPLVLEFASEVLEEGLPMLAGHRAAIEVIRRSLRHDGSPYAHLIDALVFFLPGLDEETVAEMQKLIVQGPPQESVGLEPYAANVPPGVGSATSCSRGGSVEPVAPVLVGDLPLPLPGDVRARARLPLPLRPVRLDAEVEPATGATPPDVGRTALPLGLPVRLRRSRDGVARAHRGLPRRRNLGPQLPPALPVGQRPGRDRRDGRYSALEHPPLVHNAHQEQHGDDQVHYGRLALGGDLARPRRHDRLPRLRQPVRTARGVRVPRQRGRVVPQPLPIPLRRRPDGRRTPNIPTPHPLFQLPTLSTFVFFALWLFSSLVHVFSVPLGYLRRSYVQYRSSNPQASLARDRARKAGKEPAKVEQSSHLQ